MTFSPKRLLVTGGAGFIGSNFVHYWSHRHPDDRIVVLDALTYAGNRSSLQPLEESGTIRFVHGDILDGELVVELMSEEAIDTVVHFAAESHVDRSIGGPERFVMTNVVGTQTLLAAAKRRWLEKGVTDHRFHHVSTDEVYGTLEAEDIPFTERHPYLPNSPYAASKAASDHLVRSYHHTYGLNTTISNCSNNYGPYQFPEKLIPLIIANCLDGKPLPVYGDGRQIRDWLHVDDHNRALELILGGGVSGETYNIGGNNEWHNIDIVNRLCDLMDRAHPDGAPHRRLVTHVADRPGHDRRYAIDAGKIATELGYRPEVDFGKGLEETVCWYLENETWWRPLMDESRR